MMIQLSDNDTFCYQWCAMVGGILSVVKWRFSTDNTSFDVLYRHSPDVHILQNEGASTNKSVIFYSYDIDSRVDKVCVMWSTVCVLGL